MGSSSWDRSPVGESNEFKGEWYSRSGESTYGLSYHNAQPGGVGLEVGMLLGNVDADRSFNILGGGGVAGDVAGVPGNSHTESSEMYIGALYVADTGSIRPYVGAGMTFIDADASYSYASNFVSSSGEVEGSGSTQGYYLHTGANMVLDGNMTLGLDYRLVMGTDDIQFFSAGPFAGDSVGMDSSTISLVLGFGF